MRLCYTLKNISNNEETFAMSLIHFFLLTAHEWSGVLYDVITHLI